ncbi:MAG: box helicase [Dehalococcoidia bacterium]|nr:box helicase [Dehalococcoidia bacterium]
MAEYVALDVETTGLDPQRDEIIEIGLVRFDAEGETESYTTLIDPDCPVPYSIQRLTGITGEALAGAPRKDQVLHPVVEFIGNRAIVGQNLAFDLAFLSRSGITFHNSTYDTIELAKVLLPTPASASQGPSRRLRGYGHLSSAP